MGWRGKKRAHSARPSCSITRMLRGRARLTVRFFVGEIISFCFLFITACYNFHAFVFRAPAAAAATTTADISREPKTMPDGDDGGGGGANTANPPPRHHHHHRHHRSSDLRIDIGKHIKECFDLGAQMRPLLPVTGPLSNPAKKKLGKLMAAMKENVSTPRKKKKDLKRFLGGRFY